MNATDIKRLLSAVHLMQAARMEIKKISNRDEIQQPQLIDELTKLEDEIGNQWLDARRAAAELGKLGGSANTDLQNKARASNGRNFGGRKKGSKNKPKDERA